MPDSKPEPKYGPLRGDLAHLGVQQARLIRQIRATLKVMLGDHQRWLQTTIKRAADGNL